MNARPASSVSMEGHMELYASLGFCLPKVDRFNDRVSSSTKIHPSGPTMASYIGTHTPSRNKEQNESQDHMPYIQCMAMKQNCITTIANSHPHQYKGHSP